MFLSLKWFYPFINSPETFRTLESHKEPNHLFFLKLFAALCCRGLNSSTVGFKFCLPSSLFLFSVGNLNSIGYKCWIGLSMIPFPVLSLAPLVTPSQPLICFSTTPIFQSPLSFSSPLISMISPVLISAAFPKLMQCFSCKAFTCSHGHLFHIQCLYIA